MSKGRNARELALKVLFQIEVGKTPVEEALEISFEEVRPGHDERQSVELLVRGVSQNAERLDEIIGSLAEGWRLDRLAKVDKTVLRIALFELSRRAELPASVVVNDAIEMAKKYSTDDSGRFVNGILGSFLRNRGEPGNHDDPV